MPVVAQCGQAPAIRGEPDLPGGALQSEQGVNTAAEFQFESANYLVFLPRLAAEGQMAAVAAERNETRLIYARFDLKERNPARGIPQPAFRMSGRGEDQPVRMKRKRVHRPYRAAAEGSR